MENFLIIVACMLIGMALKRIPDFSHETANVLNMFVIYISLPALVLLKIPELAFSGDLLVPLLMPWGILFFSSLLILFFSRCCQWDRATTGCLLLLIPLGNTSFLGIPMVKTFFGEKAISYALLYDQCGSFLALASYGTVIIALYGTGEDKPATKDMAAKVISFPPFIALVIAVVLKYFSCPAIVETLLETLAATLIPLVMVAVGFQLTIRLSRESALQMGFGLLIKLIVAPMAALLFCKIAGLNGEAVRVSIFEAGMPPMVSAGALAILADLSPALTSALVAMGIILSFATLPLIYQILS